MTIAVQGAVMLALVLVLIGGPIREERYRALGSPPAAVEPNAVAVFRSDATNQQILDALHGQTPASSADRPSRMPTFSASIQPSDRRNWLACERSPGC